MDNRLRAMLFFLMGCTDKGGLTVHNTAPSASIIAPKDGQTFIVGDTVQVEGLVSDNEQGDETLTVQWWLNDAEHSASADSAGAVYYNASNLEPGSYTITLYALDDSSESGEAAVTFEVLDDDVDGDGYTFDEDCDDNDGDIHPGADEVCDEIDNDCDGAIDDDDASVTDQQTWYRDSDEDGYGDMAVSVEACSAPPDYIDDDTDCDDSSAETFPGAAELDSDAQCMADEDDDGWGSDDPPAGVDPGADCDDGDAEIHPDNREVFGDDIDNDCDDDIDVADVDELGVGIFGATEGDRLGESVVGLGDIDGDGYDDVLVSGQNTYYPGSGSNGVAYIIRGPITEDIDASEAAYLTLIGPDGADLGAAAASGDANGDGHLDLLIGAPRWEDSGGVDAGAAMLVLGPVTSGSILLGDLATMNEDWRMIGHASSDDTGESVAFIGDVNGDGFEDMLVGARDYDRPEETRDNGAYGVAYLVYGSDAAGVELALNDDSGVVPLYGEGYYDKASSALAGGGDIDGDGGVEFAVGAYRYGPGADSDYDHYGALYVMNGDSGALSSNDLSDADSTLVGDTITDYVGSDALFADLDGDGYDDLVVGGVGYGSRSQVGATWIVLAQDIGDGQIGARSSVTIEGEGDGDQAGQDLTVGDFDGDGAVDLVVGAKGYDGPNGADAGAAYVWFGPVTDRGAGLSQADADGRIDGLGGGDYLGAHLANAGDLDGDGDGADDLLISAQYDDSAGSDAGAVWLVSGWGE